MPMEFLGTTGLDSNLGSGVRKGKARRTKHRNYLVRALLAKLSIPRTMSGLLGSFGSRPHTISSVFAIRYLGLE
jgi:hypothetical protein